MNFNRLVQKTLPSKLKIIRQTSREPMALRNFTIGGKGTSAILKDLKRTRDFAGCYVIYKSRIPFYVGISRKVIKRLRSHVLGKTHNSATLAYRMAKALPLHREKNRKRKEAMKHRGFNEDFEKAKQKLRKCHVAFVEIKNAEERYLFEVYAAIKLKTLKWNSFETH